MRPGRSLFALLLVLLNAGAVLLFRATITLDGPMHVLHASVLLDDRDHGQGIAYDVSKLDLQLGDLLLLPLVRTLDPFQAHAAVLALVLALLGLGVWSLSRALGGDPLGGVLLTLPVLWGWPLILGFLHFLVGVAVCLFAWAWWVRKARIRQRELTILLCWLLLTILTHRAAPLFLSACVLAHEVSMVVLDRKAWRERWSSVPGLVAPGLGVLAMAGALALMARVLLVVPHEPAEARRPLADLLQLRSLVLFEPGKEIVFLVPFGILLISGCALRTFLPGRPGGPRLGGHGPLVLAASLVLVSLFLRGGSTDLLYATERTQWAALLLLALWAGVGLRGPWAFLIGAPLFLFHLERTRYTEVRMAAFLPNQRYLERQVAELASGTTVVLVPCEGNWLYLHQSAFLAALHDGVVWTPVDHLRFRFLVDPSAEMTAFGFKQAEDWRWLEEHLAEGREPPVDRILLMGPRNGNCTTDVEGMGAACLSIAN